jgi:succinyldiaminopimelate transaminase
VASRHPDGIADLSVGTPVDPTPQVVQAALQAASDAPGYPLTAGSPELLAAARGWLHRRLGAPADVAVLPTIGSKELVALLPLLLGYRGDVLIPELAYPTYDVGARIAGCTPVLQWTPDTSMLWLNSPSNPTGRVMPVAELAQTVAQARSRGAVVVSDECYVELGWEADPVSVLHPSVSGGSLTGVLAVHSLSKRSSAAGLRLGLVSGDPVLVAQLLELRKHLGLIVPAPVQAAGVAAFGDDAHVQVVRSRYAARRALLLPALRAAGFTVQHSEAGLYLWATRGEPCWQSVQWLAERGILVAPGEFYGSAGSEHVRVALTATDERIAAAVARLRG